jgi:hypothetical protein
MSKKRRLPNKIIKKNHISKTELESSYFEMAKNKKGEKEALKWAEGTLQDIS